MKSEFVIQKVSYLGAYPGFRDESSQSTKYITYKNFHFHDVLKIL